ncbi:helix-turn-helix transcriptional regulator [Flavobacterium enshiense]|uniref:helix-turn-helix domain-containing protein n=1 Tax=Flavobacterium enshiense TaxID=1341165 RepID=UPI00345C68B2
MIGIKKQFYTMLENENTTLIKAIGTKIRELRRNQSMSQEVLSFEASVPRNQIGRIERGEINTTVTTLNKICKVLKIEIKELF